MDSSVRPSKKYPEFKIVSTTDFFYPLVTDPTLQGRIGAANVLSDMYAMGVYDIDSMLMILSVSTQMTNADQDIVTRCLIDGFAQGCKDAGTEVSGGQTVKNPWPMVGGVAQSTCMDKDIIMPTNAVAGDVIILTKPLGTQVAVNLLQWVMSQDKMWNSVKHCINEEEIYTASDAAVESMCRLNKSAARLMHKYDAHAATDITGFGLLGHAKNLASNQIKDVSFQIHTLPVIKNMVKVDGEITQMFKLATGYSSETSGGIFLCLPEANAQQFIDEIQELDGQPAWVVGRVVEGGGRDAALVDDVKILEV